MYYITNKNAFVSRIQRMLGITETGKIDSKTIELIRYIKTSKGLNEDVVVDYPTFLAIKEYANTRCYRNDFIFHPLNVHDEIRQINIDISRLIKYYSIDCRIPRGFVYGYDTQKAVSRLRQIYLLKDVQAIDSELLYHIRRDLMSLYAKSKI